MNHETHPPEEASSFEKEQLDRLADELRGAFPEPSLSAGFHDSLQARLSQSWSFRAALQRNGLMRIAAGLLMVTLVAAPVAAIVQMFQEPKQGPPTLGFELPESLEGEKVVADDSLLPATIVGPEDEYDPPGVAEPSLDALQAARLRSLTASMPRVGGLATSPDAASDALLRFQMECAQAKQLSSAQIAAHIEELQSLAQPTDQDRTALAGWIWLQDGTLASVEQAPEAWSGAPFVRE